MLASGQTRAPHQNDVLKHPALIILLVAENGAFALVQIPIFNYEEYIKRCGLERPPH